jgi:glycosyltransferase involved in cell wall biosynthesis
VTCSQCPNGDYAYPEEVAFSIRQNVLADYAEAARRINQSDTDIVCVQHEFGIFGGAAGENLLTLLDAIRRPVVTVLHTILTHPNPDQRQVMLRLAERSARLISMSKKGAAILRSAYGIPRSKIAIIPHGAPDRPLTDSAPFKSQFGFEGRDVLLTFGLLSPNKGIEVMIRALPAIKAARPDVLYVVLGATHPHVFAADGEAYRETLIALAAELGVADNVAFVNSYVDTDLLIAYLSAADIYVTPYLTEAQITSGTLSYAVGLGKAVVSTPYWHAAELLADGRGLLAPFHDSTALAAACILLLSDETRRNQIRAKAYAAGRETIWARLGEAYCGLFAAVRTEEKINRRRGDAKAEPPAASLKGVKRLSDAVGIIQHCVLNIPDRSHGYCLDDNARALILCLKLEAAGHPDPAAEQMAASYAAFIQHAWNGDRGCFRNFMSYDRRWLEESGSEDSFGRAFWALGAAAESTGGFRPWGARLAGIALPHTAGFTHLRSRAFLILGLCSLLRAQPALGAARARLAECGEALVAALDSAATAEWLWFEPRLTYDNARLPEALLRAGAVLSEPRFIEAGLHSLNWLAAAQTAPSGCFRPVGSESFGTDDIALFDQQPLDAVATIDACAAAFAVTRDKAWIAEAQRAFDWFLGENDLFVRLANPETGLCCDGLMREGANANTGAESVLAFQLGCCAMQELSRGLRAESKGEPKPLIDPTPSAR